jgi:hypothetical protein
MMSLFTMLASERGTRHIRIADLRLAIAVVVCMGSLLAGSTAAQNGANSYPVSGVVEDSLTHQPIARALVESGNDAMLTDSEGRFEFHLRPGSQQIRLRRPGYSNGVNGPQGPGHFVMVGPNTPSLVLYLAPSASITGHVTSSSGDEVQTLQITLYRKRIAEGHPHWDQAGFTRSWSDGSFRLPELLAPGLYILCVASSLSGSGSNVPGSPDYGYAATCYPGGTDMTTAAAAPLKLEPGKETQVEISLARRQLFPVSVSVPGGTQNIGLQLYRQDGLPVAMGFSRNSKTGAFETSLPNGNYYFEAHVWAKEQQYGRVDFSVAGAPVTGLTVVPKRVLPIRVNLRKEFTATPQQPLEMATMSRRNAPNITATMTPADHLLEGSLGVNFRPIDGAPPDGDEYQFDTPAQGSYWLEVWGYDSYVSSMTSGATDLLREPLLIGAGSRSEPIDITLRNDTGGLDCWTAADSTGGDNPTAPESLPLFVYAIPQTTNQLRIYSWVTQPSLRIPFARLLPPGSYLVLGFRESQEIDLDDKNELAHLVSRGQVVTITPGMTTKVVLDPILRADEEATR